VIAENRQRCQAPGRKIAIDGCHLVEDRRRVADEVAGHHHNIRLQRRDLPERVDHIAVVDARPNVKVAQLHQRSPDQRRRQVRDRQRTPDELNPVRLDAPCIQPHTGGRGERRA
jgi:hypothetical protein